MTPNSPTPGVIDINVDCGERSGDEGFALDAELSEFVSSVNVSCGAHAGDAHTIRRVVERAASRGVAVGAHPAYPDREHFGRVSMKLDADALEAGLVAQLCVVRAIAGDVGTRLTHVKPHGALYHDIETHGPISEAFANAVRIVWDGSPMPMLVARAGSSRAAQWRREGFVVASEAFCERRYQADGTLVPRTHANAMIEDPGEAAQQAVDIAVHRCVSCGSGLVPLHADTICIHSDSPGAATIARAVREALKRHGFHVRALPSARPPH